MTETIHGQLELDHQRGVIYFHATQSQDILRYGATTILRVCRLGVIPQDQTVDVTLAPGSGHRMFINNHPTT